MESGKVRCAAEPRLTLGESAPIYVDKLVRSDKVRVDVFTDGLGFFISDFWFQNVRCPVSDVRCFWLLYYFVILHSSIIENPNESRTPISDFWFQIFFLTNFQLKTNGFFGFYVSSGAKNLMKRVFAKLGEFALGFSFQIFDFKCQISDFFAFSITS